MLHTFNTVINDEIVLVTVTKCEYTPPDHNTWSSDIDYNGGYDMEYTAHDLQGNKVYINSNTEDRLDQEIIDWYNS